MSTIFHRTEEKLCRDENTEKQRRAKCETDIHCKKRKVNKKHGC